MKFLEKEFPRLAKEFYGRTKAMLDGVKNLSIVERPSSLRSGYGVPELVIKLAGQEVVFQPLNDRNLASMKGRGIIDIFVNSKELDESIVMNGEAMGPWELEVFTNGSRTGNQIRQPARKKLTDEVLTALLKKIFNL